MKLPKSVNNVEHLVEYMESTEVLCFLEIAENLKISHIEIAQLLTGE